MGFDTTIGARAGSTLNITGGIVGAAHRLQFNAEGDINVTAMWGVGDLDPMKKLGFTDVRVKVHLEGDATEAELKDLVAHSNAWSPVANTLRNPVGVSVELA